MPSRITRNSVSPRASDSTIVAPEATSSLAALSNSMASSPSAETRMDNKPNFSRKVKLQGLDLEKEISPRARRNSLLLTSFLIESFDRWALSDDVKLGQIAADENTVPRAWYSQSRSAGFGRNERLRRRDCGLQNREVEAGNRFEAPKSLASKADCTERTGRCPAKSTSSVLFQSATTTPRQTSPRSILNDYSSVECEITPRNRSQSVLLPSARCSKGF